MAFFSPQQLRTYGESWLRHDLKSGVSVFLVALPLCLGIALASGAPLFSGLLAGIVAGTLVALLSGSEVSVSGPAAGLTVIVVEAIAGLGSFENFLVAVVLAGLMQLGLGAIRAGRLGNYFPQSVIQGMLVGIGIVIFLKQIPHALGDDQDYEGDFGLFQLTHQENTLTEILRAAVNLSPGALLISGLSVGLLVWWDRMAARGRTFFRQLPAGVAVVGLGVGLNALFRVVLPGWYLGDSPIHMVSVPHLRTLSELARVFDFPDFSALANPRVYGVAATLAVVASLESLLSLEAAEAIDPQRRLASPNRELFAQGAGNLVSGLIGGLPITSVVVRTSANVYAGAHTRMSALTHGLLLLLAVFVLPGLMNRIPLSCLAAILLVVGYKLAKPGHFRRVYRRGWSQFLPFLATVLLVVFEDLLVGIAVGTVIGLAFVVYTNYQRAITVVRDGKLVLIKFNKDVTFLNKAELKAELQRLQPGDTVFIDGTRAMFVDHEVLGLLLEFRQTAAERGITLDERGITYPTTALGEALH